MRGEVEGLQGIVSGMMGEFPWYAGSAELVVRYGLAAELLSGATSSRAG